MPSVPGNKDKYGDTRQPPSSRSSHCDVALSCHRHAIVLLVIASNIRAASAYACSAVPSFALLQPRHLNRVSRYPSMGYDGGCDCWSVDLNVDWRDLEGVQGVRNEGACKASWAIAAVNAVEVTMAMVADQLESYDSAFNISVQQHASFTLHPPSHAPLPVPSAQQQQLQGQVVHISASADPPPSCTPPSSPSPLQVVDCEPSSSSCKGGWPTSALDYMVDASNDLGGLVPQLQYPYKGKQAKCNAGKIATSSTPLGLARYEQVDLYGWIGLLLAVQIATSSTPLGLARYEQVDFYGWIGLLLAVQVQPVIAFVRGSFPSFQKYKWGVYGDPRCAAAGIVDHAVLVVGYAFTGPNGQGNWIVRNSWGTKWGEQVGQRNAGENVVEGEGGGGNGDEFGRGQRAYEDGFAGSVGISTSLLITLSTSLYLSAPPHLPHSPSPHSLPSQSGPYEDGFRGKRPYEDGFRRKRWHLRNPFRAGYLPHRSGVSCHRAMSSSAPLQPSIIYKSDSILSVSPPPPRSSRPPLLPPPPLPLPCRSPLTHSRSPGGAALVSIRYSSNSLPSVPPSLPPTPSPHHPPPSATKPHQFRPPCLPPVTWPLTLWGRRKINSLPSVPPPLPPTPSPPSPSPINRRATPVPSPCDSPQKPCGGGVCVPEEGGYSCQCPAGFVSFTNDDGMQTCAPLDACGTQASNPCLTGTCINDNAGGYFCLCPPGYVKGSLTLGWDTCTPSTDPPTTLTFPVDVDCPLVYQLYGLTEEAFLAQNSELASPCATIPANTEVNVAPTSTCIACSLFYSWTNDDSCSAVAELFEIDETELTRLNPGLDCSGSESCHAPSPGQQICVREGDGMDYPMCSWWEGVKPGDTCATLMQRYNLPALSFFWMNPGLTCDNLFPNGMDITGVQVCLFAYIYISTTSASYRSYSLTQPLLTQQHRTQPQPTALPLPSTPHSLGKLTPQQSSSIQHPSPQQGLLHQSPWKRVWTAKHLTGKPPFQLPPWQQPAWQQRWARLVKAGVLRVGRAPVTKRRCLAFYSVTRGDFCARIISLKFQNSARKMAELNNGYVCNNDRLYVGLSLCTRR
ncbi:unnamed protein product [Closterium sp. NIES-65]|nr:unnamed protein product [Closterium sp. NIES-65]